MALAGRRLIATALALTASLAGCGGGGPTATTHSLPKIGSHEDRVMIENACRHNHEKDVRKCAEEGIKGEEENHAGVENEKRKYQEEQERIKQHAEEAPEIERANKEAVQNQRRKRAEQELESLGKEGR